MIETKSYSAMLYALADELRKASPAHPSAGIAVPLEEAAERLDTLTVTIRGLEIQRFELLAAIENLHAQKGRHNTEIAYKRLIETLDRVKGGSA